MLTLEGGRVENADRCVDPGRGGHSAILSAFLRNAAQRIARYWVTQIALSARPAPSGLLPYSRAGERTMARNAGGSEVDPFLHRRRVHPLQQIV
jgi:hypothetical protein